MMKKAVILFSMLVFAGVTANASLPVEKEQAGSIIQLYCSPDLVPLGRSLADAFPSADLNIKVSMTRVGKDTLGSWLQEEGHMALVTKEYLEGIDPGSIRLSVIGREIYIPVMNPKNPCREIILQSGIAPEEFAGIYASQDELTWGALVGNECTSAVHPYRIEDPSFMGYLAQFTGMESERLGGEVKESCSDVFSAVRSDPRAVGFCTLTQLMEMEKEGGAEGVIMIPVDINENGQIDPFEQVYGGVDELARGIWIGKYPAALYSRIYAVSRKNATAEPEHALIHWLVTDGQDHLAEAGFSSLLENERSSILAGLSEAVTIHSEKPQKATGNWLMILGVVLVGGILTVFVFRVLDRKSKTGREGHEAVDTRPGPGITQAPGGYFMDRSHTWCFMERNGEVRIGIDYFLKHVAGEITRVQLKNPGDKIKKGEPVMSLIQHGKTMEILSPVSGVIIAVNEGLQRRGSAVNSDPYAEGWVYLVEPVDWMKEIVSFRQGKAYGQWIEAEVRRLKDFIAVHLRTLTPAVAEPVFQEGGALSPGLLEQFGPEAWEEFQSGFLNK